MLKKWGDLPVFMQEEEVRQYWETLNRKKGQLAIKRIFDFSASLILLFILLFPMVVIAILIKLDSKGSVFFRQERVTAYGKQFRIHKFRTMIADAESIGTTVTINDDPRITVIGKKLRKTRLDELPQLIDILEGNMSFVGTRPEAVKYVNQYKPEYYATLLLKAGVTSEASIRYTKEEELMQNASDADIIYLNQILPAKMEWNLNSIRNFSIFKDIMTMLRTVSVVFGKEYQ